ncbi:putative ubiquinone biosynthesis monooxygenase [Ascosphaera pollenicola]|nr:putative ubiquinone biosynthesis monooxygenase [Ascosphaera pollenicola]
MRKWQMEPTEYSNRTVSLCPSSVSFLKQIGVWDHVDRDRVQPYEEMQVWDAPTSSHISFDLAKANTVATIAENVNLVRGMLGRIDSLAADNVSLFSGTTVADITTGEAYEGGHDLSAWPVLTLAPSKSSTAAHPTKKIAARLLVGADGINSPVRKFASIYAAGWDYNRHGVVAALKLDDSQTPWRTTAFQRFLPEFGGPIALLPLPNGHASLVWSTKVANATYLKSLTPSALAAMINAAFRLSEADLQYLFTLDPSKGENAHAEELEWRLQHVQTPPYVPPMVKAVQPGTAASFPLRYRHTGSYIMPRVALVGDAAHVIHPLAGLGLNLGLGDVAALTRTIQYSVTHGMDIGDLLSLEKYVQERYLVNAEIGGVCDLLHKAYNITGNGPLAWARSLGVNILDQLPPVKNFLTKQAAGAY